MVPSPSSKARLLVVDDHALIRQTLAEYLALVPDVALCGVAASGEEALDCLASTTCDLAIVDVAMPEMNGIELVRRLRALYPDLPCLMLSGQAEQIHVRDAVEAGARGYVMKGDPGTLMDAVREVLGGGTYFSGRARSLP